MQSVSSILTLGLTLLAGFLPGSSCHPPSARSLGKTTATVVHDFPLGYWAENLAVRASGQILTTILHPPGEVYQVDPALHPDSNTALVHRFTGATAVTGIAEGQPDIFYVAVGNFSTKTDKGTKGSWSVWSIDFNGCDERGEQQKSKDVTKAEIPLAIVQKVVDIPPAVLLNGLTFLEAHTGILLAADSSTQVIYAIDVHARTYRVAINETETRASGLGVNGVKVHHASHGEKQIFFTNSGKYALYRQLAHANGSAAAPAEVVFQGNVQTFEPDDFLLDSEGSTYVANFATDEVVLLRAKGEDLKNVTRVVGPTAITFGRSKGNDENKVLYVSSSGGAEQYSTGNLSMPGAVYKIDL